eukprot:TRINITY_DN11643_c0_g1_i2.p1 TRINITY_DN11643_c0_g1~~TRINITY_DN11643_c0_g1_i2.p1  ORF type:complete len:220 (+),score=44.09 TRINITY_DN11643_c0_g1_i2:100-759(+)
MKALMEPLHAAESALQLLAEDQTLARLTSELKPAEELLRNLLARVTALQTGQSSDGRIQHACEENVSSTERLERNLFPSGCASTPSNVPDALDDWYSDPWSDSGKQEEGNSPEKETGTENLSPQAPVVISIASDQEPSAASAASKPVQVSRHDEQAPTEPQWQYGRCVAVKLVSHSPAGSSAYEQLLTVLLTVFQVSESERRSAFIARRKANGGAWWPF